MYASCCQFISRRLLRLRYCFANIDLHTSTHLHKSKTFAYLHPTQMNDYKLMSSRAQYETCTKHRCRDWHFFCRFRELRDVHSNIPGKTRPINRWTAFLRLKRYFGALFVRISILIDFVFLFSMARINHPAFKRKEKSCSRWKILLKIVTSRLIDHRFLIYTHFRLLDAWDDVTLLLTNQQAPLTTKTQCVKWVKSIVSNELNIFSRQDLHIWLKTRLKSMFLTLFFFDFLPLISAA